LNLLRILRGVCDVHPNRGALVERYGLSGIVGRLSKDDGAVLVRELAREIGPLLKPALAARTRERSASGSGSGTSATPGGASRIRSGSAGGSGSGSTSSALSGRSGKSGGIVVAPKRARRTASETAIPQVPSFASASAGMGLGLGRPGGGVSNTAGPGLKSKPSTTRLKLGDIPWQARP